MRRLIILADAIVALGSAVWAWMVLFSHSYKTISGEWRELEWTPFWWLLVLAVFAGVNGVYIAGQMAPRRLRDSRLGRMAGLWVDAKEADLKRRAKSTEPE